VRRQGQRTPVLRRSARWSVLTLMLFVALTALLSACGAVGNEALAQQNEAKLNQELQHARKDLGIPDSMLQPITSQEQKIADGEGGFNYNYDDAASNYQLLYTQLTSLEQTAVAQLQKQADADIQAFSQALNQRVSQGFSEGDVYQSRLDQARQDFSHAQLPGDYAKVDNVARQNTEALHALWPAYQKLQDFKDVLRTLRTAGLNTAMAQLQYQQDLGTIREAASAGRYAKLAEIIDGQIVQLMADQAEATPYVGAALLDSFQARIDLLHSYGQSTTKFQQQHDADAKALASAKQLADYLTIGQTINKHIGGMTLPLVRGKAHSDYATLARLVDQAAKIQLTNHYDGTKYSAAYEYSNPFLGVGDAKEKLDYADALGTTDQYQYADDVITELTVNLRALVDNLHATTPHSQPHATDLQLMQYYNIMQGKVLVISLREQTLRAYENGKMVYWAYVTTGRSELPSWPGLHYAMYHIDHTKFTSPEPKTSPFWYAPTPITYGIAYAPNGFFIHDAWWRSEFGPDTNLPHFDPAAFNGGSHGCINLPTDQMQWVWSWTPDGAPIIVY
jgi:L,D-transpeptidase catalytic domain